MRCEVCHGTLWSNGQPCLFCLGGEANCCDGACDAADKEFIEEGNVNEHKGDDALGLPAETGDSGESIQPKESESSGVGEGGSDGQLDWTSPRKDGTERNSGKPQKDRQSIGRRRNFRQQTVELKVPSEEDGEYETDAEGDVRTERKVNHPLSLPRVRFLEKK